MWQREWPRQTGHRREGSHELWRSSLHILVFLGIAGLAGVLLYAMTPNDEWRICAFGGLMLLLSLEFPWAADELNGRYVDLIYYTAAMVGIYFLFVSTGLEKELTQLQDEVESLQRDRERLIGESGDLGGEASKTPEASSPHCGRRSRNSGYFYLRPRRRPCALRSGELPRP